MKSLFFFLTLWTFLPLFAGYAPDNVQTALTKMYPSAKGIAWSQDEEYYVADFMMNGFDTKVWFNTDAEWVMKQTDWETLDEGPAAVFSQSVFGRGGTECCLGAISQMATYCSHTGGQAERADKISDIVYSER